jgi:hypothetical protein
MTTLGKFTLFEFGEFRDWLMPFSVSRAIRWVQNHHTYLPDYKQFNGNNHFQHLQSMEQSHLERGFSEIAQNLTTFPDGKIALCRSLDKIPAGIKGANTYGVCIENFGNFDLGMDAMNPGHKETILRLNALLCTKFGLTPDTDSIVYHHWYDLITGQRTNGSGTTKTCPGTNFFGGNTIQAARQFFIPAVQGFMGAGSTAVSNPASSGQVIQHGMVNASLLNVRSSGNPTSPVVKQLLQRTPVGIYEEKNGWYCIGKDPGEWVAKDYITIG